jgi:nucleoside-diphosphate-sugar epimerase
MALSRSIIITGANGNIGQKIARHLLAGTTTVRGEVRG